METAPIRHKHVFIIVAAVLTVGALVIAVLLTILWSGHTKNSLPTTPIVKLKDPVVTPALVTTGLKSPVVITAASREASDTRLFVAEQAGVIRVIKDGRAQPEPLLDIQSKVLSGGEMGLLGVAFHPGFKQNGYFYINYIDKGQNTVIARFTVPSGKTAADPASETVLLTLKQPYPNHNGGDLLFGPDGYLYATLGDGGSGGDPENRAQNKSELLGKILRLDVDKTQPYAIPPTNPFVNQPGVKPEIWAYGLRNPWRISFDRATGDLFIADVGQGTTEEIDLQKAGSKGGENYGWRCYEGSSAFRLGGCGPPSDYVKPILEYDHADGRCSVTGGYVYRGAHYPALEGKYFYGDYCSGQLFYAEQKGSTWTQTEAVRTPYKMSTFGEGASGELYVTDLETGSLYRIEDAAN